MDSLKLTSGGATDVGRIRKKNEDAFLLLENHKVYCVADGMGGAVGGDLASQKTIELIKDKIQLQPSSVPLRDKIHLVFDAVNDASEWIFHWAQSNQVQGTGTTLVALILSDEYPWATTVLHAGDSRLYLFRDNQLKQISKDHSIEQVIGANGGQSIPNQFKGVITNAIGLKKKASLEITHSNQLSNDIWILCSDGLSNMLSENTIRGTVSELYDEEAQTIAQALVDAANDAGGRDNVSVIVVKVHECSEMPADANAVPFDEQIDFEDPSTNSTKTDVTNVVLEDTTDSSDLVSIQTPSLDESEEHNIEVGKHAGRWIRKLVIGAGLILILVLSLFMFAIGRSQTSHGIASEPVKNESHIVFNGSLSEIKQYAIRTGDWSSALHAAPSNPNLITNRKDQQEFETIQSWNDRWVEASRQSFPVVDEYGIYYDAYINVLSSLNIGNALPPLKGGWSSDSRMRANEYCRRVYLLQDSLLSTAEEYITNTESNLSFFKPDFDASLRLLYRYSDLPESTGEVVIEKYQSVGKTLESFGRWVEKNKNYPIAVSQLTQLTASYISAINDGASDYSKQLLAAIDAVSLVDLKSQYTDPAIQDRIETLLQARQKIMSRGEQGRIAGSPTWLDPAILQDFFMAVESLDQMMGKLN